MRLSIYVLSENPIKFDILYIFGLINIIGFKVNNLFAVCVHTDTLIFI